VFALGSAVDEHLDGSGSYERAAEPCANTETRGHLQQLPGEELVDPDSQLAF